MMKLFKFVLLGMYIMLHVLFMIIHKIVHSSSCIHGSIVSILLPMQLQLYYNIILYRSLFIIPLFILILIPNQSGFLSPLRFCLNNPGVTLLALCHCTRV